MGGCASRWQIDFLRTPKFGTSNVIVDIPAATATQSDVEKRLEYFRQKYPYHDFRSLKVKDGIISHRFLIAIATGIETKEARDVQAYAKECIDELAYVRPVDSP